MKRTLDRKEELLSLNNEVLRNKLELRACALTELKFTPHS